MSSLKNVLPLSLLTTLALSQPFLTLPPPLDFLLPILTSLLLVQLLPRFTTVDYAALSGKHIWLVGASRGIGAATAQLAAKHGATLTLSSRDANKLAALRQSIPSSVQVLPLDVASDWATLRQAHAACERAPDIVIVNAGINHTGDRFVSLSDEQIDSVIATNLTALTRIFRIALPNLLERDGTLVAISSLSAYRGLPGASVYGATKAAVTSLCQALNVELYNTGVRVVAVHPGFVQTDILEGYEGSKPFIVDTEEAAEQILRAVVGRMSHWGFPGVMEEVVMRVARMLPDRVYEYLIAKAS